MPTLAIVGRPNVGKSTLFNRLVGARRSIVGDEPGITRDRIYGEAEWTGRRLRVVDTGGILPEEKELIPVEIFRQAQVALEEADAIVLVVDGRAELTAPDMDLAQLLRRGGKPLFLAVNKIDDPALEAAAENFRRLGIRELYSISAEHGTGVAELLEAVLEKLPFTAEDAEDAEGKQVHTKEDTKGHEGEAEEKEESREVRVAIMGRPNVGKSTLLNRLTGTARAIVSAVPGTTRDAVDEVVERDGAAYRFIDTAGIRRKGKTHMMAEKLSVVMARKHLESADIALLIIDATEGVTALDATIAGYAHESGRSLILVVNKWDLAASADAPEVGKAVKRGERWAGARQGRRTADAALFEQRVRRALKFLNYAPIVFVSAVSGASAERLFPVLELVARERRKRVGTGEMNRFLKQVDFERATVPFAHKVKVLYMTQAHISPPTFILFTDRAVKLHFGYERFLENQIRKAFGFVGTPIWIKNRAR